MIEYQPEQNPYRTLVIDVTHRCNMACANCYIPNRDVPDMDADALYAFLRRLPSRTQIRIIGAEPTMRRDLPSIITSIKRLGHRPVLLTNGLRLASRKYVQELKDAGLVHCYISMNGVDVDEWYKVIDGMACAKRKVQAFGNIVDAGMVPNIGCIMQGDVNRDAPSRIVDLIHRFGPRHCVVRLKNVGQLGRYSLGPEENLTLQDIMREIERQLGIPYAVQDAAAMIDGIVDHHSRLFPLGDTDHGKHGQGIWFKLTDWGSDERDSLRRGRVTQDWTIAPFFEHVKENEFGY